MAAVVYPRVRRVVFVNRYFHPDHSATSQMASDLAFHLASRGWEVAAITSRQRYDDARANLRSGTEDGVRIERIWSTRFGRAGLIGRAFDYATFYLSAFFAIRREIRRERGATIIAMTDPPLLSVVAALASRDVVNWTQDLFPEVAQALGIRVPRFVQRIRDWSLRKARANVVLGELMARRVPKATVIHNWAGAAGFSPPENGRLKPAAPRFVVGYSGNLGRAHDAETIAAAIRLLPDVKFVFTGGGAKLSLIRDLNVEIRPYVAREQLEVSLSSVDVHLVSLLPQLEGLIVPSKFYGVLAVGRPVIFLGARDGELARVIEESRCGLVAETADQLASAIRELKENPEEAEAMGSRGRALYLARFAPEHAFAAWERVLSG
ncbi:MAG TPA: glycosyltransferase family 4 protein [Thermoanaerobaculia bacterium]|nr:glycosyltransferase family 4 protein [Thermoanaerobaculia bacterium]